MRALVRFAAAASCALGALSGCSAAPEAPDTNRVESAWGTLKDDALTPTGPQYLVNKARGGTFKICLARYVADALPGVETELDAAVNVWASYLGRSIAVTVDTKDLPRARADQSVDAVAAAYQSVCGAGYDVVVGFARLDGAAVGLTGASYRFLTRPDGTQNIVSFSRYLFLRDYDLQPSADDDGNQERWTSIAAVDGRTPRDLLQRMIARSETRYATANAFYSLPVLTHEIGHVWGLCDQYESSTNCDPLHSSSHLVESSIMGARGATARFFLTDDDVEGIRALAARPGFDHDWGRAPSTAPAPLSQVSVGLARIESVRRASGKLLVTYGVVTNAAARYEFSIGDADDAELTPLTSDFGSEDALDIPTGRLSISLSSESASKYRVRLRVIPSVGAPVVVDAREP